MQVGVCYGILALNENPLSDVPLKFLLASQGLRFPTKQS